MSTAAERREQAFAMLKADPTLARQEIERRKQNKKRRASGEPLVHLAEADWPLNTLGKDDLEPYLDG